ncbi:MAG: UDP-N-acetylmuramoyl-L-alanyl-D-glutamate--2,6-diaminopimelate ligase [Candidatus Pacebacteria bacterium]|nr:UDP-N-acetylmuramoyl-L-alanyl-D-glutamate--2,6-diaminopimelate ligase [Candidatus Paceibacterota bacterium]
MKNTLKQIIPPQVLQAYHLTLAYVGAFLYGFPSRKLRVIAVTGTKGKSSTTEMINTILEENGEKTALLNSIRFKLDTNSEPNLLRMSMPGRFFIQSFLADAVRAGCTTAVLEMTSEGAKQYRHRAIDLNALVFTNLAPEHIESHGSFEAYSNAKFEIGKQLQRSKKRPRVIVANADDSASGRYLTLQVEASLPYTLSAQQPYEFSDTGGYFTFENEKIAIDLPGEFSLKNALAAATVTRAFGVPAFVIARALSKLGSIPGRAQRVEAGQDFTVIVDYAHTPDSLKALYDAFAARRKICVLGSTGGGRDKWKRPVMAAIADEQCEEIILTDEDPYDEDPLEIVQQMEKGMKRSPTVIMDRRAAIGRAIELAKSGDAVLITGKGTDPCICIANGKKIPWSDAQVAREEITRILSSKQV